MSDLRVIKTKSLIKGAFIELVEEKGFDNVSIKDICNKALINRNTFYLHYYDKVDLLRKMADEVFFEQEKAIDFFGGDITIENRENIKKGLINVFNVLYKEIEFYRVILLDTNMSGYINNFENELKKRYISRLNIDYDKNKIELDFIFYGITGVIRNWIIKDYASIDDLSNKICDLMLNNNLIREK